MARSECAQCPHRGVYQGRKGDMRVDAGAACHWLRRRLIVCETHSTQKHSMQKYMQKRGQRGGTSFEVDQEKQGLSAFRVFRVSARWKKNAFSEVPSWPSCRYGHHPSTPPSSINFRALQRSLELLTAGRQASSGRFARTHVRDAPVPLRSHHAGQRAPLAVQLPQAPALTIARAHPAPTRAWREKRAHIDVTMLGLRGRWDLARAREGFEPRVRRLSGVWISTRYCASEGELPRRA